MATTGYGQFLAKAGIGTSIGPNGVYGVLNSSPAPKSSSPAVSTGNQSASQVANNNAAQITSHGDLNIPTPSAPSFDPTPFDNLINSIGQLGNSLSLGEQNAETAINQNTDAAISDLNANKDTAQGNLDTYKTQATNDATNNINEQRRAAAEIQQGIQARYGGTTGTGSFVAEQAGNTSLNNIAKYRTDLQGEYGKVANMQNQLLTTYINQKTQLENTRQQQIADAKQKLTEALSQLEVQKGQIGVAKSQQQSQLLSNYQNTVAAINANNTQYQRDLAAKAQDIQNQLQAKTYEMTYNQHQRLLNFYEQALANGNLTPQGITEAANALGVGGGSLQLKQDTAGSGLTIDPKTGQLVIAGK